jgi:hypothetical protein
MAQATYWSPKLLTAVELGPAPFLEREWPKGRLTSKTQNWNVDVSIILLKNFVGLEAPGEDQLVQSCEKSRDIKKSEGD